MCIRAKRCMTGGVPPHPVAMRGCQFGLFELCEFSNIAFERLELRLCWEIRHYVGNRFVSRKIRK